MSLPTIRPTRAARRWSSTSATRSGRMAARAPAAPSRRPCTEIAGMGINVIRLPLVPQTLNANDPQGTGNVLKNHPSVRIANSRLALETMIRAADAANIEVHARHALLLQLRGLEKGPPRCASAMGGRDSRQLRLQARELLVRGDAAIRRTVTTTHPYNQTAVADRPAHAGGPRHSSSAWTTSSASTSSTSRMGLHLGGVEGARPSRRTRRSMR